MQLVKHFWLCILTAASEKYTTGIKTLGSDDANLKKQTCTANKRNKI